MEKGIEDISVKFLCPNYVVLLVDDDNAKRNNIRDILFRYGIYIDTAADANAGEKLFVEHDYDLVLVDEDMKNAQSLNGLAESVVLTHFEQETICSVLDKVIPDNRRRYIEDDVLESGDIDVKIAKLFMLGVDVITAVKNNGGLDDYIDLLDLFYTDGYARLSSFDQKIKTGNFHDYTIEVHGLKSSAANIGAYSLSDMAKQHEMSGKNADYTYIENNKETLFECFRKILGEIERVLKKIEYGQFSNMEEKKEYLEINSEEELEKLNEILTHIEKFRSKEAAKSLEILLNYAIEEEVRTKLNEIAGMLRMYEDDNAEDALRELISNL